MSPCLPPVPGLVWCEEQPWRLRSLALPLRALAVLPDKGRFNKVEEGTRLTAFKLSLPPSRRGKEGGREGGGAAPRRGAGGGGRPRARLGSVRPGPARPVWALPRRGAGGGARGRTAPLRAPAPVGVCRPFPGAGGGWVGGAAVRAGAGFRGSVTWFLMCVFSFSPPLPPPPPPVASLLLPKHTRTHTHTRFPSPSPSTRPKRQAKPAADEGFWDCSVCTFRNSAEAFKCSICDVRKGTSTRYVRTFQHRLCSALGCTDLLIFFFSPLLSGYRLVATPFSPRCSPSCPCSKACGF